MTGVTTGQTALPTCTDSDDTEVFLTGALVTAEQTLADKFDSTTGHSHSGSGQGGPLATGSITPAMIANRTRRAFIPFSAFREVGGTPAIGSSDGLAAGYWALDGASTETVAASWLVPSDWDSGTISFAYWITTITDPGGSNAIRMQIRSAALPAVIAGVANAVNAGTTTSETFSGLGPATNLNTLASARTQTVSARNLVYLSVARIGGDAADTCTVDIGFMGLELIYTADS